MCVCNCCMSCYAPTGFTVICVDQPTCVMFKLVRSPEMTLCGSWGNHVHTSTRYITLSIFAVTRQLKPCKNKNIHVYSVRCELGERQLGLVQNG